MAKKTHKQKLKERKDKVKDNPHNRKYIDRGFNPNVITAVYCKGCGAKIKGLNKDNQLITYSNYREMLIEFDDGSAHMTPTCRACMNVTDKDDLEAMYVADLEEFDIEDDGKNSKVWDFYFNRKPEKIKQEA